MNEAEDAVSKKSVEEEIFIVVIILLVIIAVLFGGTTALIVLGVLSAIGPGLIAIYKIINFIQNIVSKIGQFFVRVANLVFSNARYSSKGGGWGVGTANDPAENLPAGTVGTNGFTAGGNVVGDPMLEEVNSITTSDSANIGGIGSTPNYSASFPLGDPFQGPSYLVFGPLDEIKYTPFWLPVVEDSTEEKAKEEAKYLELCPYSNPLYKEKDGLSGNTVDNPLIVKYDNTKNTPQYNFYGNIDSNEDDATGKTFADIANGSFALDDNLEGDIRVASSKDPDVANSGSLRLSSNSSVWIKDMRTGELRLVPFQTLNGTLRVSTADTSLKYIYKEEIYKSGQTPVLNAKGEIQYATIMNPKTQEMEIREITTIWSVKTGGTANVSAILNLGFGLSPMEGYVLKKRTGLLINQDKIYAVPGNGTDQSFTVSGGYADLKNPNVPASFDYYHESPGAGIVIFNLRSTGADSLTLEEDKKAYFAQQNGMSYIKKTYEDEKWVGGLLPNGGEDELDLWLAEKVKPGEKTHQEIYDEYWENIETSSNEKPDFLIKETSEQFIISMEYKPFTSDMIRYWANQMPNFKPFTNGEIGTASYTPYYSDEPVKVNDGQSTSFLPDTTNGIATSKDSFGKLYVNAIDDQGFNYRLGEKGDKSLDVFGTGKIYADPYKSDPTSFVSRFLGFNPFTAFGKDLTPNHDISTPLFAFESGVETYVGTSEIEYTQYATYKTSGPHQGYEGKEPINRTAGEQVFDLYTGVPLTETITIPGIKIPWGPNPISAQEVELPMSEEELSKYVYKNSMAFDYYALEGTAYSYNGFDVKISDGAMNFYNAIKNIINADSIFVSSGDNVSDLNYLPLMDKTKLATYKVTKDKVTGKYYAVYTGFDNTTEKKDRAVYPLYVPGISSKTTLYLTEFKKSNDGTWVFNRDMIEPDEIKKGNGDYKYIVTPKLPDKFATFTKYVTYSEGEDFNRTALGKTSSGENITDNYSSAANKTNSSNIESNFTYNINPTTGELTDKNKTDELLANLYKIRQGDMKEDGTLTDEAKARLSNSDYYQSPSEIGTFAIVDPKNYFQVPQEYDLSVTEDNVYKITDPSQIPVITPVQPPSLKDLSTFKGFPSGNPLGTYNTCVTSPFGLRTDVGTNADFHLGVDLSTGGSPKPIYATLNGVVKLGTTVNGGNVIEIWSSYVGADGKRYYIRVRFCHTSSSALEDGTEVKAGDLIGYSGNSGTPLEGMGAAYGYHLHYEIRISSNYNDLTYGNKSAKNPLDPIFGISGLGNC